MRKLAGLALLAIAVASCGTREDNSLGVGLISDLGEQKAVRYVVLAADSSDDFQSTTQPTNAGDSPSLTLGSQAGMFVRSLLQFDSSVLPPAGTVVDSAWVVLIYQDGNSPPDSLPVPVAVHRVASAWGESEVPDPFPTLLPAADSLMLPLAESGDTALVTVTSLAQFWVDQPDSNQGMAIVPTDTAGVMLEYASRNSARPPKLLVHWTANGADTSVTSSVVLDISPISTTPSFVPLADQPGLLTVGRGLPSATLLRFPLPELGDRVTVNRAVLTLHVDRSLSDYNPFTMRFQRVVAEPWAEDSTMVGTIAYGLTPVSADVDSMRFELGSLVTAIEQHDGNFGMLMRAHENRPDCDYVRFYGPAASPGLAPSLQLWYTPGEEGQP